MNYCPNCGAAIEEGNKFCSNCGQPLTISRNNANQAQQGSQPEPVQKEKHHTLRTILMVIGAIVVIGWVYNFFTGGTVNYDLEYKNGSLYYTNRDYEKAEECFSKLEDDYKDTGLYRALCQAHLYHFLTDDQLNELKRNLDFNDAKNVLVSDTHIAEKFLDGYWKTSSKSYTLEFYFTEDACHVETNLAPSSSWDKAESFYIKDGVFGLYMPKKEDQAKDAGEDSDQLEDEDKYDRKDLFRISILEKNKIAVVILKDDSRHVLERD